VSDDGPRFPAPTASTRASGSSDWRGDKGLSLAERITSASIVSPGAPPIHGLRLKGRHPLKLIACPTIRSGDPRRGNAARRPLSFRGETRQIAISPGQARFSAAVERLFHSFAWLRDLSTVGPAPRPRRCRGADAPVGSSVHADKVSEPAWRADSGPADSLLDGARAADPVFDRSRLSSLVLNTLGAGARHIDRGADKLSPGAPRVAAACGIVAAGLLIPGSDGRRTVNERRSPRRCRSDLRGRRQRRPLARGAARHHHAADDGARCYAARRLEAPASLVTALNPHGAGLLGVCHAITAWRAGKAEALSGATIEQAIEATGIRTRPLRQARDWGYQRLASASVLIMDAAPPPVARLVEGGCASTLASEFSTGRTASSSIVAAPGPRSPQLPPRSPMGCAHGGAFDADSRRQQLDRDPCDGTLVAAVAEVELARQRMRCRAGSRPAMTAMPGASAFSIAASWCSRRRPPSCARGYLLPQASAACPPPRLRDPLPSRQGVQVSPTADGWRAAAAAGGALCSSVARGGTLAVEDSLWIDGEGRPSPRPSSSSRGESPAGGASVSWALVSARPDGPKRRESPLREFP